MDAVTIDAMIVEAVRAERERIKLRLEQTLLAMVWVSGDTKRTLLRCAEED